MADLQALRPNFVTLGGQLVTANIGTIDYNNPDDIIGVQVSTALSQMEIARMRIRQKRAARQRTERGLPKRKRAFGYVPNTRDKKHDDSTGKVDTPPNSKNCLVPYLGNLGDIAGFFVTADDGIIRGLNQALGVSVGSRGPRPGSAWACAHRATPVCGS